MALEQRYTVDSFSDHDDAGFNRQRNVANHINNSTGNNDVDVVNPGVIGGDAQALRASIATTIGDEAVVTLLAPGRTLTTQANGDDGAGGVAAENQRVHVVVFSSALGQV